jgi:hypothetical protein
MVPPSPMRLVNAIAAVDIVVRISLRHLSLEICHSARVVLASLRSGRGPGRKGEQSPLRLTALPARARGPGDRR